MPFLEGTSEDVLRRVGWRGTLISAYALRDVQVSKLRVQDWLFAEFQKSLTGCAWRVSEGLAGRGLYHMGVIEAQLIDSISLEFSVPVGCDLSCVCAAREFRMGKLGLDEIEYYRKQMADRLQYELSQMLSRSVENYIQRTTGFTRDESLRLSGGQIDLILPTPKENPKPNRKFEIVRHEKMES